MTTKRSLSVLLVATALGVVQVLSVSIAPSKFSDAGGQSGDSALWNLADSSPDEGPRPQGYVPIQNISLQVEVPPSGSFYVYFDQVSQTLKTRRLPDETAGLPPEVVAAITRVPTWIRSDFTKMMARLSELIIDPTSGDDFSSPAIADINGDGSADVVLGDVTGQLTLYSNVDPALHYTEGYDTYINGVFVKDSSFFPSSVKPVGGYSRASVGDLNGDNLLDLAIGGGDGRVYVFQNAGPPQNPTWTAQGAVPTVSVAANAAPALADLDGDGDLDLMVGNSSGILHQVANNGANPQFVSDGNPATTTTPTWMSAVQLDLGIPSFSSPTFGDIDEDGQQEMAVGEGGGIVSMFDRVGSNWVRVPALLAGMSAGGRAAPALRDLDDDTLLDLVVGGTAGPLRYYANVGSSTAPKFILWQNYTTNFDYINFNQYYWDANHLYLAYRSATPQLMQYVGIVNNAQQKMVDEIAFSIAKANAASLLNPSSFPEVYLNNTESLYFNSQFTRYAQILDYDLGTEDQWSTVRYLVNESGNLVWYEYPRDIYYWWLVSPKGTDEMATFINPDIVARGHEGARNQSNGGLFWRWAAFNMASPVWPPDPGRGYPKEEPPPVLRGKLLNATVLWNDTTYTMGAIYNSTGWFLRDVGGNVTRPWNATDQAVEIVDHWVASTVPLNAQAGNDPNRPRQPVRIQWEHNGNCGEISDMLWAGLRSALIPSRGVCGYGGDHCWGEFYERGWHQIDDYWDASVSIIANNDNYHYGWNRDWSGIMAMRGDGLDVDVVDNYHKTWNASNDARYPIENHGLIDRANVSVYVRDANGNPVDGVKVAAGDYRYFMGSWATFGTQWTFTDINGRAFFTTSEARQNWNLTNPDSGDSFDDGIAIFVVSKMGPAALGDAYSDRLKPSYGDAYNPRNAPMHYYNFTLQDSLPRPFLPMTEKPLPPSGIYVLNVSFAVDSAFQRPAVGARWDEGLAYHKYEVQTGQRVTSFFASESDFGNYKKWQQFGASSVSYNTTGQSLSLGIPPGQDWYFVISNPGTLETTEVIDLNATLLVPTPQQRSITITSSMIGRRLMSLPVRPLKTDIQSVTSSVSNCIDYVRWRDPMDAASHWKSYVPGRQNNGLLTLDETMGFWINFTSPCTWTITGYPAQSTAISLKSGWNLVGYPSNVTSYTVADMIASIGLAGVKVESFDPDSSPYNLWVLPPSYALKAGEGYWIYVPQDCHWIVTS